MTKLRLEWTWKSAKQQPLTVFVEWRDQQRRQLADKALALRNENHSVNDAPSTLREKAIDFIFYTTSYTCPDYSLVPENYLELVKFCEDFSDSLFYLSPSGKQKTGYY